MALTRKTPLRRKTPIRAVSPKARDKQVLRRQWRTAVFTRDNGRCRLCAKRATDAHHIVYRSQGGPDELWNGIALCRSCHEFVHANGRTARPRLLAIVEGLSDDPLVPARATG